VSNVRSGTVVRLDLAVGSHAVVLRQTQIATGYTSVPNDAALILGPTGLAYDPDIDVLYVASTADNTIFAVPHAGIATRAIVRGDVVFSDPHLRGLLPLAFAENGDLLTSNGDAVNADPAHPSSIVEFTRAGQFVSESNVDTGPGAAFGLATSTGGSFSPTEAAANDNANTILVFSAPGF
jgi:hypothetical protein